MVLLRKNFQSSTSEPEPSKSPEITGEPATIEPSQENIPSELEFTGYGGDGFSSDEQIKYEQMNALRRTSPVTGNGFEIIYNYATAKFDVYLTEPLDTSRSRFNIYIQENYAGIPIGEFNFTTIQISP